MYGAGGQKRVPDEFVRNFATAIPSVCEQQFIASFLNHEIAKIDTLISEQRRLIGLLKEKRQSVISHAVTKGLDPYVTTKSSGIEWLGDVPAQWDVSQLRYVVRPGTSITYGIVQAGPHVDDGVPYIKTSDMAGSALPMTGYSRTSKQVDEAYVRSRVSAGDLVIAIRASVGKCLIVPPELAGANLTQGTAKISPGVRVTGVFLHSFINSSVVQAYLSRMAKGATFKEITLETLRKTPVLVPPLNEQHAISSWLAVLDEEMRKLITEAERAIELLQERRTALISAAVTGKIDVRELAEAA